MRSEINTQGYTHMPTHTYMHTQLIACIYHFCLCTDPPEVFPLSMNEYVKNESDLFTIECVAFGVPLPQIFWIPSPLMNVGTEQQQDLLANTTRFDNVSSLCPTVPPPEESSGSGVAEGAAAGSGNGSGSNLDTAGCASSLALGPANCS